MPTDKQKKNQSRLKAASKSAGRPAHLTELVNTHPRGMIMALLALGLLWRLIFFFETATGTSVASLTIDERYHHETASAIAQGQWLQAGANGVFFRAPLYYYLLGVIYLVASDNLMVAQLLQILLSTVSCLLVYLIAKKLFNPPVAFLALLISCFYGAFFYFATQLLFETLLVFLCLAGWLLLLIASERQTLRGWLASGLVFGLAAITRPPMLVFLGALALWIYWSQRQRVPLGRIVQSGFAFYLGCLLPILPVTLHNYFVGHDFVLIASQGGVNFYMGNNAQADGISAIVPEIVAHGGDFQNLATFENYNVAARAALNNPQAKPSEIDRYWYQKGLAWIQAYPGDFLGLMLRKFYYFWNGHEIGNDRAMALVTDKSVVYRYLSFPFWLVGPLAFAGVYLAWRDQRRIEVLLLFAVTFSASILIFFVNARFRLPIVPVLIMLAAYTLNVWQERLSAPQSRTRHQSGGLGVSMLIAVLGLAFVWPNARIGTAELSAGYYLEGQRYLKAGDYSQAIIAFEQAKAYADARGDFYTVSSRVALGQIYTDSYPDFTKAEQNFLEALERDPDNFDILNDIGVMYIRFGQYQAAQPYLSQALQVSPGNVIALENLAYSYEMTQEYAKAIEAYQQLAQRGSNAYVAYTHLGNIYWLQGDAANARAAVSQALDLNPGYGPAKELLAKLPQ